MQPVLEETIYVDFIVCSSTGAATDADSTPTAEVFEDATDTTVVALTVTKRTSKTGNYRIPIACTAANGFEAGKSYNVIVSATVGGIATKAVAARFQVRAYSADNALRPTVAGRTLDVSVGGEAGLDWANVGSPTTTLILSGTTVATVTTVGTATTLTNLPTAPTDWLTAAAVKADAVTKIQTGLSTYAGADTAGTTTLLSRVTGAVALATQIPANFTSGLFASAGVFSTGALANAPTGGSAPTVLQIRQEMDANSTKLAFLTGPVALAATALSTAVWTNAKAAFIDAAISGVSTGGVSADDIADAVVAGLGTINANVVSMAGNVVTASALASDAVTEIQAGLMLAASYTAPLTAAATRTAVGLATANLDTQLALRTGYKLASDGLDAVAVESGVNARQALSPILAAAAGVLSGADTNTIIIKGAGVSTTRITATVDTPGNRSAVTLNLPT